MMISNAIQYVLVTYLGIISGNLSPEMTTQHKLHQGFGQVIQLVAPKSPAHKAGLKKNDILLMIDDQHIVSSKQIGILIRSHKNNDKIKLTIIRDHKKMTLHATLKQTQRITRHPQPPTLTKTFKDRYLLTYIWINDRPFLKAYDLKSKTPKKTIFDGPIATPAQQEKLPPILKKEVNHQLTHHQLKKRFQQNDKRLKNLRLQMAQQLQLLNPKTFNADMQKRQIDPALFDKRLGQLLQKFDEDFRIPRGANIIAESGFSATASRTDDKHTLTLTVTNQGKHVKIKNRAGKILYNGPLNQLKDYQKLSPELQKKVRNLEKSLNIQFNPPTKKSKKTDTNTIRL